MEYQLYIEKWISKNKIPYEQGVLTGGNLLEYDFPQTADFRDCDGVRLELNNTDKNGKWIEIKLYPLKIGRPEYIPYTTAKVLVPPGQHSVEVALDQFDYTQLTKACLKYISHMTIALADACPEESVTLIDAKVCLFGDFFVTPEVTSMMGNVGDRVIYRIWLENKSDAQRFVTISTERSGRESVHFEYPDGIVLEPWEKRVIEIYADIPDHLPHAGYEKKILDWCADGVSTNRIRTILYVSRCAKHPSLLHTEEGWNLLKNRINNNSKLQQVFDKDFLLEAETWEVPEPYDKPDYVYPFHSKDNLLKTAVAWKLTGKEELKNKLLKYLLGFLDKEKGYLSTQWLYFNVVGTTDDYKKGYFKVHRAGSALWVHEGEYMSVIAIVYDLLYNCKEITPQIHYEMEQCMRYYMEFESWRLTEGDGNNFQISEASAALTFACLLQDYEMIDRFLAGCNGIYELLGAGFSDDGSYFEGASGYMKLVAELMLKTAVVCERYSLNFKNALVTPSYDKNILHSVWALRKDFAEDKKPFLGMSFERFEKAEKPYRTLKDYIDNIRNLLTPEGIMFSANDSNEQSMIPIMEKAYYLYKDPAYKEIAQLAENPDLLYGLHMVEQPEDVSLKSYLNTGNGYAVLREKKEGFVQAVLKYGQHGGYHGHFDRLSLVSYIRDDQTFHNQEYAWYGYFAFLFKMWVQTSMAHNMVIVDRRMQEPTACENIYFHAGDDFQAVCAQTVARWCDPPYGGQTPYLLKFPEEKSAAEGRYVLPGNRSQGAIGEYSEPVFQRRLLIMVEGICVVWDYVTAEEEHDFDCMYHPIGSAIAEGLEHVGYQSRLDMNPYGSGQFVLDCHQYEADDHVRLEFHNQLKVARTKDIMDFASCTALFWMNPNHGDVFIGRYPKDDSTFYDEELQPNVDVLTDPCKKVIGFHTRGKQASFITALEIGREKLNLERAEYHNDQEVRLILKDRCITIKVDGINQKNCKDLEVSVVSRKL